ncbi:sugar phosphate isomerase/epimerase family protein [Fluviispira sanaruensis]|uniref:Sugar phosphate isomerase/epimerase n=1 Tax=Fluviispira sanaruensis TaxID=2493639 RepID=A0A4P2VUC0_FLUSA|nr:TIM barrel protein [Fluviispira sanaruensis]BBH53065.1 sugar phosphate isomerase/epimerase [Fluviispira sanaruensis]
MYSVLNITKDYDADNSKMSSTIGHEEEDFLQSCKLANKYEYIGINIDLEKPKYSIYEMKNILKDYGLIATSFHFTVKLSGSDIEFYESLEKFTMQAESASKIGCKIALNYIPPFSNKLNFDSLFKLYVKRLILVKNILIDNDIKIAFEFIGPTETRVYAKYDFIHTIDGVRCLISAADLYQNAGFKLDVHHWQHSGSSLLDLQHLDLENIIYLELNDGLTGYNQFTIPEFKRALPLKTGVNDVKGFLMTLYNKGFRGPVAIEPWNEELASMNLEVAIKQAKMSLNECFKLINL